MSFNTIETRMVQKLYQFDKLWRWCVKVNDRTYGIDNIALLLPEWELSDNGDIVSFAYMLNKYNEDMKVTHVGFEVNHNVKLFRKKTDKPFHVCLRYRHGFPDGSSIHAVINDGLTEHEVAVGE